MSDLRLATKLYIAAVAVAAGGLAVVAGAGAERPGGAAALLALALAGLMAIASSFPLPLGFKTKTHLDSSVIFAAMLLFEPGVAMGIVAAGVLIADVVRRQPPEETLFNVSQYVLQTGVGGFILAAGGWDAADLGQITLGQAGLVAAAGVAKYAVNTLSVGTIVGLQAELAPLRCWHRAVVNLDRSDHLALLAQLGIGLLAAALAESHPWALPLLLLPILAVDSSLERLTRLKERAEAALEGTQASLAEAQRIARLGSWEWDLDSGEHRWSEEAYRIFAADRRDFFPTQRSFLGRVQAEDRPMVELAIERALRDGAPYSVDHRIVFAGADDRMIHVQGEVIRDPSGRPVRMVGAFHDITERKRLEQRLAHQAFHDDLTGLPNRARFTDRLGAALHRAAGRPQTVAVLFLDLDRFKTINDRLGHEAGDRLLTEVAARLLACIRPADTVARLGGDEFTVLLEEVTERRVAIRIAEWIEAALTEPIRLVGQEVSISTSIGIAFNDGRGVDSGDLLRDADQAMYRAKEGGRARHAVFEPNMSADARARLASETALREAIERKQFVLVYQPRVLLRTGEVVGFEALVRWDDPDHGLVPPSDFLPLAEETGLVVAIDRWALGEACRQAVRWRTGLGDRASTVSVNLSTRWLQHPGLIAEVAQILVETRLPPAALELEIAEQAEMDDAQANTGVLNRLKALGVRLAIDDFGIGPSRLGSLDRLPIDLVKIDRTFVAGLDQRPVDAVIAKAVVDLAEALRLEVVAEGIERESQARRLLDLGCLLGQGFLFSPPVPAATATDVLASRGPRPLLVAVDHEVGLRTA